MDGYEVRADPDAQFVANRRDIRAQDQAVAIRDAVRRSHFHQFTAGESVGSYFSHTHDGDDPEHEHPGRQAFPARADGGYFEESGPCLGTAPPEGVAANIGRVLEMMSRWPETPAHQLMRWRLRLYCGHVVERTSHIEHRTVHAAFLGGFACPECDFDPATIVAARVLGPAATPPKPAVRSGRAGESRASLASKLSRARAEVERLEAQLKDADADPKG